ncbi:hypothetical protein OAN61_00945 [bacterium]|nr:hypothetical protein [bacterium]
MEREEQRREEAALAFEEWAQRKAAERARKQRARRRVLEERKRTAVSPEVAAARMSAVTLAHARFAVCEDTLRSLCVHTTRCRIRTGVGSCSQKTQRRARPWLPGVGAAKGRATKGSALRAGANGIVHYVVHALPLFTVSGSPHLTVTMLDGRHEGEAGPRRAEGGSSLDFDRVPNFSRLVSSKTCRGPWMKSSVALRTLLNAKKLQFAWQARRQRSLEANAAFEAWKVSLPAIIFTPLSFFPFLAVSTLLPSADC